MSDQTLDRIVDSLSAGLIGLDDFMSAVEDRVDDLTATLVDRETRDWPHRDAAVPARGRKPT